MLAIIKDKDKQYTSQVLAISNEKKFWDVKIIIFDKDRKSIKMTDMYRQEKIKFGGGYRLFNEAFIFDYDESDFVSIGKWRGLSKIIENNNLIGRLKQYDSVEVCEIFDLKNYIKKVKIPKWYELKSDEDIKNLELISNRFHDACLENAIRENNNLTLSFNAMDCKINLRFEDITEENIENKVYEVLDSKFSYDNNEFKWTILDGFGGWVDGGCYDIDAAGSYIKCKRILWNFEQESVFD